MTNLARVFGALLALGAVQAADAATIDLATGRDSSGLMAAGSTDSDWQISVNGGAYVDAKVAYPAQICCGMASVSPAAAWVTDPSVTEGSFSTGWGSFVPVVLRTTFDLTNVDLATVILSGTWRVADNTLGLFLNGVSIPGTTFLNTWDFDSHTGPITTGFVAGMNTFEIRGDSINSGWDAFWFAGTVTHADVPNVPLPAGGWLLLAGLGGLAALRRRG